MLPMALLQKIYFFSPADWLHNYFYSCAAAMQLDVKRYVSCFLPKM